MKSTIPYILDTEISHVHVVLDVEESDFSRAKRLEFYVDCNGYFTNLATILDLIVQDKINFRQRRYADILTRCKEDLLFLEKHYKIIKQD
jgi:hypothetical protein